MRTWNGSFVAIAQKDPERYRKKFNTPQDAREFAHNAGLSKKEVNEFVRTLFPDLKKLRLRKNG